MSSPPSAEVELDSYHENKPLDDSVQSSEQQPIDPAVGSPPLPSLTLSSETLVSPEVPAIAVVSTEQPTPLPSQTNISRSNRNSFHEADQPYKQTYAERIELFRAAVDSPKISLAAVRKLAKQGIPDNFELRPIYWKILLNYLGTDRDRWEPELKANRETYQAWVSELVIDPHARYQSQKDRAPGHIDHPLSQSAGSAWSSYFKDVALQEEIDKDVKRTFPHLHFFNKEKDIGNTQHYEALRRILFIYAKLNPGVSYVQGMNEIIGPIYYVFATDIHQREHAEADAFHCFKNLMSEIMDNFLKTLDFDQDLGIACKLQRLTSLLKEVDEPLWQHFEEQSLSPQYYAFRWITLLFSQEFELPEVLLLWDALFF